MYYNVMYEYIHIMTAACELWFDNIFLTDTAMHLLEGIVDEIFSPILNHDLHLEFPAPLRLFSVSELSTTAARDVPTSSSVLIETLSLG